MYTDFFGLSVAPFNSTMDSRFFYASPQHEEALASMLYAVQQNKGLITITGEVGTGKTLLANMLIEQLNPSTQVAMVTTAHLLNMDILQCVCREYQLAIDPSFNTMELLACLEEHLLAQRTREKTSLLIVDDAHGLDDKHFEQLRLMNNLEVSGGKLLQIVLLGQPDLATLLNKPARKQLRQRIFRTFHIPALSRNLTEKYIENRLQAGGMEKNRIFEEPAVDMIYQFTRGVPRLINNLCDNLLLSAFSSGVKYVDVPRVSSVIDELTHASGPVNDPLKGHRQDEIEQAITEITGQYVQSLENQITQLETTSTETDQRIHELHRLSTKLKSQELKFAEHQTAIDTRVREMHRLTVTLQEQEQNLGQREKTLAERLEQLRIWSQNLEGLEKRLTEREAKVSHQVREMERMSTLLVEQDQKLTERANFIDKKLASRQVAFDRELNECKRAINRKWQEMKQMVDDFETRETDRSRRLALIDQRFIQFEKITSDMQKSEAFMLTTHENSQKLASHLETARRNLDISMSQLGDLIRSAGAIVSQPQVILDKANRLMEQTERMTSIVNKASDSLEKTVKQSWEISKKLNADTLATRKRIEELEEDAMASLREIEEKASKAFKLRDVYQQVHERCEKEMSSLKTTLTDGEKLLGKLTKQVEELKINVDQPVKLVKELRSMGSVTERNLHDGQVRLAELRTMIEKADRARVSIEALVNATRRMGDSRRQDGPMMIIPHTSPNLTTGTTPRKTDALTQKIETLADAVRRVRNPENIELQTLQPSESLPNTPEIASNQR